jgi:hypothetical protein
MEFDLTAPGGQSPIGHGWHLRRRHVRQRPDQNDTQAPDNFQSTATYSITVDSTNGWQISDVGGIGAVVGAK